MQTVYEAFEGQAGHCDRMGSPFTASLCRLLAERLDRNTRFGLRVLDWPDDPVAAALPLRACAALHALARSWKEPDLKSVYPPAAFDANRVWTAIVDVLHREDNFLARFLDSPPQTNEVGRSAVLLGAALHIAAETRLPLELMEIGASAGLNLAFEQYAYDLGQGRRWGRADAPLTIPCEWHGAAPPLDAPLTVVARAGCDRNPLDAASEADAERLVAYVWPDQAHRLQRLEAALKLAAAQKRKVERADAADWVERRLARPARRGVARLLFHTVVWPYLPAATQGRIDAALQKAGAAATAETPLARFSMEGDGNPAGAAMTLTLWPGGRPMHLGRADFHGKWCDWDAA